MLKEGDFFMGNKRIEGGQGSMGADWRTPRRADLDKMTIGPAGRVEFNNGAGQQRNSSFNPEIVRRGLSRRDTNRAKGR